MQPTSDPTEILRRARSYPYSFPRESYLYDSGRQRAFRSEMRSGRTPVLAFGSNQSPERLEQKFGIEAGHQIPVERGRLSDFDVVYSAHITRYGAIPAMLQHAPAHRVEIAITWLDDVQLDIMHESEMAAANYYFAVLEDVTLQLSDGTHRENAYAYIGTRGHWPGPDGAGMVPLSAIACHGRRTEGQTTAEALNRVYVEHGAEMEDEDAFILRLVKDADYRAAISTLMAERAVQFSHPFRRIA